MNALALVAGSLEKFATEVRALQKTEVRELEEPFGAGQKGSSAMPHKRNPVGCEQVSGLARLVRANAAAALENIALWHERDISHSSVERVIVPDSFLALDHMLHRFTRIVRGMVVNEERMRRNLDLGQGLVYSGQLLLELTARGMRREDAYRVVQAHAMEAWKRSGDFRRLVYEDPEIRKTLTEAELDEVFRLERYFDHVDAIFTRVFGPQAARGGAPSDPS
jgi:adenylosuccinate lyase